MEEKTITIKKGDIFNAFDEVSKNDKSTRELFNNMPMMIIAIGILIVKIEKILFGEEEN